MASGTERPGIRVFACEGVPASVPRDAVQVNVGGRVPVALHGLKRLLWAVQALAPELGSMREAANAPEWNVLFPESPIAGRTIYEVADAPNQRRLFRESEQTFRVLNFAARLLVRGLKAAGRPIVLHNVGACDLVSLRGIMHAVQCSRLDGPNVRMTLAGWRARSPNASRIFTEARASQEERAKRRMTAEPVPSATPGEPPALAETGGTLEAEYLSRTLDARTTLEHRLAASLLAVRACFFSTNHEGAMLAAETGLALLEGQTKAVRPLALLAAWDALDDATLDIPMLELDRDSIIDGEHVQAQLLIHAGVVQVFTGDVQAALATFERALGCAISPELASDVRLYRALVLSKMMGNLRDARQEVALGLEALHGRSSPASRTSEAWLHNLMALTHFQEKHLEEAQQEEELALSCIDNAGGHSAAHLKTNLISNFSVVFEARGDVTTAMKVWRSFAGLNAKLKSDAVDKVYLNRLGALQREAGDLDAALTSYTAAFAKAEVLGDRFHAETIAAAIGRLFLDRGAPGDHENAARWYRVAAARAKHCGDCLALARDLTGVALATEGAGFEDAKAALAHDTTHERERDGLLEALEAGDRDAILRALPKAKSKLSRPFAVVNL